MRNLISSVFVLFTLLAIPAFVQAENSKPNHIQLEYDVMRDGTIFGVVKESYTRQGNQYTVESKTKGRGFYAMFGTRELHSEGQVTKQGLKPNKFTLKRGDNERKSLSASFDWAAKQLTMLVKGETRMADLAAGTQDLASYPYQFMFSQPKGAVDVALTTGKKLKQYHYSVKADDEIVVIGDKIYHTLHLVNADPNSKKKKALWLDATMHYLPVKYLIVDKHGDTITQVLRKVSIQ